MGTLMNESRFRATWISYQVALIPLLGLPFFVLFFIIAIVRINKENEKDLKLLFPGLYRALRMNFIGVIAVAILWFLPNSETIDYDTGKLNYKLNSFPKITTDKYLGPDYDYDYKCYFPKIENPNIFCSGYSMRGFEISSRRFKIGKWIYYYDTSLHKQQAEVNYNFGKLHGKLTLWYQNGHKWMELEFDNDLLNGHCKIYDVKKYLRVEYFYTQGIVNKAITIPAIVPVNIVK